MRLEDKVSPSINILINIDRLKISLDDTSTYNEE